VRHGESLGNVDPLVHAVTADHARDAGSRIIDSGCDQGYLFEGWARR
jgi:hypothetical protein